MNGIRRTNLAVLAVALLLPLVIPSRATATDVPPGLTGELLTADPVETTATCQGDGPWTLTYAASGTASGPYPGTFTEIGTIVIGTTPPVPAQFTNGFPWTQVTELEAFFVIDSAAGQVSGTKHLAAVSDEVLAICADFADRPLLGGAVGTGSIRQVCACPFGLSYEATIDTLAGTFADAGASGVLIADVHVTAADGSDAFVPVDVMQEAFASTGPVLRINTMGRATGGGHLSDVSFGFEARSDGRLRGGCVVVDHASGSRLTCTEVTAFAQIGNRVVFSGHGHVDGTPTTYRIEVIDVEEPGAGVDRFDVRTAAAFGAAGVLVGGNVQVHATPN